MTAPTVSVPDPRGRFGPYGGRYVPETLIPALDQLARAYAAAAADPRRAPGGRGRVSVTSGDRLDAKRSRRLQPHAVGRAKKRERVTDAGVLCERFVGPVAVCAGRQRITGLRGLGTSGPERRTVRGGGFGEERGRSPQAVGVYLSLAAIV